MATKKFPKKWVKSRITLNEQIEGVREAKLFLIQFHMSSPGIFTGC
jgi:hypothetical protein